MSSTVTNHVLLDVQKGLEVLVSECSLSCLMLTTYGLKAIVAVVLCCAYPEFATLSTNDNELYLVSLVWLWNVTFWFEVSYYYLYEAKYYWLIEPVLQKSHTVGPCASRYEINAVVKITYLTFTYA